MVQLDAKGLIKACQALNSRISSRDWPGATREIIEIYLDEAERSKTPDDAIERACIAYWGSDTFFRIFGDKPRRGIREAMRRAASEFASDPQEVASNSEVRPDDLASQLRWFSEKKKWPKGLESMPELLAKAAAAVSAVPAPAAVDVVRAMLKKSKDDLHERKQWGGPTIGAEQIEQRILVYEDVIAVLSALDQVKRTDDEEETYQIGVRDGYSQAVQEIDQLTGGDGEYRYCTNNDPDRHTPGPAEMIGRIVARFETLNLIDEAEKRGDFWDAPGHAAQDNTRLAVKALDAAFGLGVSEAHELLRENAGAKRIYDCAISALCSQMQDAPERKPLDLNITKEWFEKRAALEGDHEIGAGRLKLTASIDPTPEELAELHRLAHRVPEGWQLVPIEPTRMMDYAGHDKFVGVSSSCYQGLDPHREIWSAMLSAVSAKQDGAPDAS